MSDVMQGIEEDVVFDHGVCDGLETACRAAASAIEGQAGSRASYVTTAMQEFRGRFSELFTANADVAKADATELANRLREVATAAGDLQASAEAEQQRRETARQWKQEQDDRNAFEKGWDGVFGGDDPPVGPADPAPQLTVSPPVNGTRETPTPGSGGGGGGGTSSARPADLRSFADGSQGLDSALSWRPGALRGRLDDFAAQCQWGTLDASGVMTGFDAWLQANDNDVTWARTVADAFAAAGGEGEVSTLSDASLMAALQAAGVDATRDDIVIDPAIAVGNPPTTGYANDPVNTATGNFLENEVDLGFTPATATLALRRTYNSFDEGTGCFGPGWSSWAEAGLEVGDESGSLRLPDGRRVVFPRLGDGWDRATGENAWLERVDPDAGSRSDVSPGYRVSTNDGLVHELDRAGRLVATHRGAGTRVEAAYDADGRLVALEHERGRSVRLRWEGDRVVEAGASDGRRVVYGYDGSGRLTSVRGPLGTRTYRWDGSGLLDRVADADGVVEAENTYDEHRRVVTQRSQFGRVTRFVYLPGRVTVVSDEDGERSNTWISDARGRLVGVVDTEENRQSTAYDPHGNVVAVTERDGSVTVHQHDDRGRRVRSVSPDGLDVRTEHDDLDRVTSVTVGEAVTTYTYEGDDRSPSVMVDPEGGRTELTWRDGLLVRAVDPTGVSVDLEHDEHGDLVATTDGLGATVRLERDDAGRVVRSVSATGATTTWTHDGAGRLVERVDPDGATWRWEHTTAGRLLAVVDPTGARHALTRGAHGEVERSTDALGRTTTQTWSDLGHLEALELPDGASWHFVRDGLSRLVETVDPAGGSWQREHDAVGTVVRQTDAAGVSVHTSTDRAQRTVRTWDALTEVRLRLDDAGRLVATELADGSTALTRYDRCGRPVELVDGAGATTRLERDAAGRVVRIVHPSGATETVEHDACGRVAAHVDATGVRTTVERDAEGRVLRERRADGEAVETSYDACGRVVRRRVPGWGTATLERDLVGRVVASRDPQHGRREFRYDAAGQLVEAVDARGGVTRYEHDLGGRLVAMTDPAGGVTRWQHDVLGRPVAQTDPLGRTRRAGYDAAGRQRWQEEPTGERVEWVHDDSGRVVGLRSGGRDLHRVERDPRHRTMRVVEDGTVHELVWDAAGRLVTRRRDGRGPAWEYDADGHWRTLVDADGRRLEVSRDAAGRVVAAEHPLLGRVALERDGAGRTVAVRADGSSARWSWADGFVVGLETEHDGEVSTREIVRDEDGRVAAVRTDGVERVFTHDEAHQLVESRLGDSVVRWRYDAAGRLVAEEADGQVTVHEHDAAGQLLEVRGPSATTRFSYDAAGRRTASEVVSGDAVGTRRELSWDVLGWLDGVTDVAADGSVRRTDLKVDALGELASVDGTEVFWDSRDPSSPLLGLGGAPVVGPGSLGVPVTGLGDAWTALTGEATARASTTPWSVPTGLGAVDGSAPVAVSATGELVVAGLEWLRARAYDPGSRAFLSVDALVPEAGAVGSGNPYAFAGNDPLHALDPWGLRPVTEEELQAYRDANNGWVSDNWEYLVGGAMVLGGAALMTLPVPGIAQAAGAGLIAAGADTIIQKATTGEVNWGQVAVSGALGMAGGGAFLWAKGAGQGGVAALRTSMLVNGGISSATSGTTYAITNRDNLSWRGAAGAMTGGFVSGAVGGAAGPAGGTIATSLGRTSTSLTSTLATAGINAAGGSSGSVVNNIVSGEDISVTDALINGGIGAGGTFVPTPGGNGMNTLNQQSYFGPRTAAGALNFHGPNTQAMWGSAGTGALYGGGTDVIKDALSGGD